MTNGEIPASPPEEAFVPGGIQTFACPHCGGSVSIRAAGISITAVCQSCGSVIDVKSDNYKVLAEAAVRIADSQITIGTRGNLFGTEWEVIGYCTRTDETGIYPWREYLLFNPYQGFRFLVESDGHWNFVKMLRQKIEDGTADNFEFKGRNYRVYVRGGAIVTYAMGEFYWRMQVGEETKIADYIAPPYMLSMEQSLGDIMWSHATYVPHTEIVDIFGLQSLPKPQGVSPNQPPPYAGKFAGIMSTALLFFILLFAMQWVSAQHAANQVVYNREVQAPATYKGQLLISDPIELTGATSNVQVSAQSPVSNNWVELDMKLVNDATQETEDAMLPIEYYHGSDSDGYWSEGSQMTDVIFSAVPAGKYHLQVEPDAGLFAYGQPVDLQISVVRDKPLWSNFWMALLLLMGYPLWVVIRRWHFETRRWSNSDYAPAAYGSSSEETSNNQGYFKNLKTKSASEDDSSSGLKLPTWVWVCLVVIFLIWDML